MNDKRFQIEVPEAVASSSALPSEYELKSQRKGAVRRYHTKAVSRLLEKLSAAEAAVAGSRATSEGADADQRRARQGSLPSVIRLSRLNAVGLGRGACREVQC